MLIITVALIIYFVYTNNISNYDFFTLNDLISDSKSVSSNLVSEGYPNNWDKSTVKRIGLTDNDHRINNNKAIQFGNMTYNYTRKLFGTAYDYLIFFENNDGDVINVSGFCGKGPDEIDIDYWKEGKCNISLEDADIDKLVKSNRYLVNINENNKKEIVSLVVYLWS